MLFQTTKNQERGQPSSAASKRKLEAHHDFDKVSNMSSQDKKNCLERPTKINDDHCSEAKNEGNSYIPVAGYRLGDIHILSNAIKNAHKCVKG